MIFCSCGWAFRDDGPPPPAWLTRHQEHETITERAWTRRFGGPSSSTRGDATCNVGRLWAQLKDLTTAPQTRRMDP